MKEAVSTVIAVLMVLAALAIAITILAWLISVAFAVGTTQSVALAVLLWFVLIVLKGGTE